MSDVLLQSILDEMKGLRSDLAKAPKATSGATGGATAATADQVTVAAKAAAAKKAAEKAAAEKAAAEKTAAEKAAAAKTTASKPAGPNASTKAPGGKFSLEQVREKIREVATNPNLGKQSAADILEDDGGGVKKASDLKPENYDKVYEACQVALQSEGAAPAKEAAPEDDLM
jgi:hypothetical protein